MVVVSDSGKVFVLVCAKEIVCEWRENEKEGSRVLML